MERVDGEWKKKGLHITVCWHRKKRSEQGGKRAAVRMGADSWKGRTSTTHACTSHILMD